MIDPNLTNAFSAEIRWAWGDDSNDESLCSDGGKWIYIMSALSLRDKRDWEKER